MRKNRLHMRGKWNKEHFQEKYVSYIYFSFTPAAPQNRFIYSSKPDFLFIPLQTSVSVSVFTVHHICCHSSPPGPLTGCLLGRLQMFGPPAGLITEEVDNGQKRTVRGREKDNWRCWLGGGVGWGGGSQRITLVVLICLLSLLTPASFSNAHFSHFPPRLAGSDALPAFICSRVEQFCPFYLSAFYLTAFFLPNFLLPRPFAIPISLSWSSGTRGLACYHPASSSRWVWGWHSVDRQNAAFHSSLTCAPPPNPTAVWVIRGQIYTHMLIKHMEPPAML